MGRPGSRRSWWVLVHLPLILAILVVVPLALGGAGCAPVVGGLGFGGGRLPEGLSRDQLLSLVASCHLLRVGQNLDNRVTDATVISAAQRFKLSFEDVIGQANEIVLHSGADGPALAERATQACADLALLTGVRPALVRLEESGRPRAVWLRLDGTEITDGFADRVIRELRDKKAVGLIINSPGGSVYEARRLGRYLRANGLRTGVDEVCVSACIDVLAGGAERYALRGARLGIHQSRVPSRYSSHEGGQLYVADSFRYLREMGVDADVAIAAASVPNDKLLLIPLADALETRLITAVVDRL